MQSFLLRAGNRLLPDGWRHHLLRRFAFVASREFHFHPSFSQEGEDMVLRRLFGDRRQGGFYVDIGAHHPSRFSNTRYFYERGWRGLNVDAMPGSMAAFERVRPRDVNVEAAISRSRETLRFHCFEHPQYNGFDPVPKAHGGRPADVRLVRSVDVQAYPLAELLERHVPAGQTIDFLSIDIEGADEAAIETNDWSRFRPGLLIVEDREMDLSRPAESPLHARLAGLGYRLTARTFNSCIYRESNFDVSV